MKTHALLAVLAVVALLPAVGDPAEGKWTPEQLLEHQRRWLTDLGLEINPATLWSEDGGGLLEACVDMDGCSGALISADGLMVTNYHCAFPLVQQHSSTARDLMRDGFLAASPEDELPGRGTRVTVPSRFTDVSDEMEAAVPADADDLVRFKALQRRAKELVAQCEASPVRRCQVVSHDDGIRHVLVTELDFGDVRLVWAPPKAIGEYGGEVDNWTWPRHTGDFALLRVWADEANQPATTAEDNRPYRPDHWFEVSTEDLDDGSFVMVPGFPWRTYRRLTAEELRVYSELYFPQRGALYRKWIDIMLAASKADEQARIALASRIKRLANAEKNARGQIAGLERGRILEGKHSTEEEVLSWAVQDPQHGGAVPAHAELEELAAARRATWDHDFLLSQLKRGPLPLGMAMEIVRWVSEQAKPDLDRLPGYQERDRERLVSDLSNDQRRLHLPTEELLLADVLERAGRLPADQRIATFEPFVGNDGDAGSALDWARALMSGSKVHLLEDRLVMLGESSEELHARQDTILELAFALDLELRQVEQERDRRSGTASRHRPVWRRAVAAFLDRPLDPDANGSLRVSLGHVRGYSPRDGVLMLPQTTLAGVIEKHTGDEPFDAPEELRTLRVRASESRWADPDLDDVPVAFLADLDTTGGNSGSPVLDGRGRLVGINFDRVWENVANDFGYNPELARNISVDIRYMLWMLEEVHRDRATPLLNEMGLNRDRRPRRRGR
jgi:hypothetical protein